MPRYQPHTAAPNQPGSRSTIQVKERAAGVRTRPIFSVILCTYNRCSLVLSALASLRRQTLSYAQFEVIVVDNGSSDGTLTRVQSYVSAGATQRMKPEENWRVRCALEPRNGLAYARNRAIRAATGEIAVFLDDDALATPHFLERLQAAYKETGADAIGGRVEIRWEAPCPHWLSEDLFSMLGHFAPATTRMPLPDTVSFSNVNFSVKMDVLRSIGQFSPFISKRISSPTCMEIDDICQRLRLAGYKLWYEPAASVMHRASAARLQRAFFVGRAYWQGRSEVLAQYADMQRNANTMGQPLTSLHTLHTLQRELSEFVRIALVHRPLHHLAGTSSSEQLLSAMVQSRIWGHIRQLLQVLEHAPATTTTPSVLLVCPTEKDGELVTRGLQRQDVHSLMCVADIPLSWLWRHRAHPGQAIGIIHIYRPGAFELTHWQRQRFWLLLWLAQHLGIRIVTTDTGGWWQNVRNLRFLSRRAFERKMLSCSDLVLTYTHHPSQLYPDKKLQARVCCLSHPGFRGYHPQLIERSQAYIQLGIPSNVHSVYLCFTSMHSEQEILHLIDAFFEAQELQLHDGSPALRSRHTAQLLLVGSPRDRRQSTKILKRAAINSSIHLFMEEPDDNFSLYMGAADALVMPHFALPTAGVLEMAMSALSYERVVIVPDLPRFQGMLPSHASVLYTPANRTALAQALLKAQAHKYALTEKGVLALDAAKGWGKYAQRLSEIYKQLLFS